MNSRSVRANGSHPSTVDTMQKTSTLVYVWECSNEQETDAAKSTEPMCAVRKRKLKMRLKNFKRMWNYDDVTVTITTLIRPPLTHTNTYKQNKCLTMTLYENINSNFPMFSTQKNSANFLLHSYKNKYDTEKHGANFLLPSYKNKYDTENSLKWLKKIKKKV